MNKLLPILIFSLSLSIYSYAQKAFQDISFDRALQKAKAEKKLIFLQFESNDCIQCNEVADKAFSDADFSKKLSSEFISLKISPDSRDRFLIGDQYDINGFGTLFIDENGKLIYLMKSTSSTPVSYEKEIETAYARQRNFKLVAEKEKSYFDNDNKNTPDLEKLIQAKTDLGLTTDLLLTEYIGLIHKDSINRTKVLQFLMRQAPVYRSKSDIAMRNSKNSREAWYLLSVQERTRINNQIFKKSIKMAAVNRDENLAKSISRYAMGATTDELGKQNNYDKNMMSLYGQTRDTSKYFALAIPYYDRYMKSLTSEFLKRVDSTAKSNAFKNPEKVISKPMEDGKQLHIRTMQYTSPYSTYSNYIFKSAVFFNHFDPSGKYIDHTIRLARKSVELSGQYNNMHLLARLLYKKGEKEEAIKTEERAIAISKEHGAERKEWYAVLEKMKAGQPLD